MSIKINNTLIKKIVVSNTEVFLVYKKFINANQCIWVKPFDFERNSGATIICTKGSPGEPSIITTNRTLGTTDTVYAFEKIKWSHSTKIPLANGTTLIRLYPWQCEISFLNGSTVVGTKTDTYSVAGLTPTVIGSGDSNIINRTFSSLSSVSFSSSIICDDATITLSDFDKIRFNNKRVNWTTEDCSYSLDTTISLITRPTTEVAMFPRRISATTMFGVTSQWLIEPIILPLNGSVSFNCGTIGVTFTRMGTNVYTIYTGSAIFFTTIVLDKLWTAAEV